MALWILFGTTPGELEPEETFTYSELSWSTIIPYLLPPSIMIHGILPVQFTCLTVFLHNLSPSDLWSTSWLGTLHFIFSPNHCLLFAAHAHIIATCFAVVPRLCHLILVSLSTLYLKVGTLSCSLKPHIHLTILIPAC